VRWAVEQLLQERIEGVILVARENETVVGVLLGVSMPSTELGRVLVVQDFFVEPHFRRRGVGRALACRILQEARDMGIDEVDVEILPTNSVAMAFWKSMSFETTGRTVHRRSLT
jgi:ribosomal protein S18 acetylase RimI-like enzyme